jgi:hypothetical protein
LHFGVRTASLKYSQTKVVAVEPEDSNFDVLEKNTKNVPNIRRIKKLGYPSSSNGIVQPMRSTRAMPNGTVKASADVETALAEVRAMAMSEPDAAYWATGTHHF